MRYIPILFACLFLGTAAPAAAEDIPPGTALQEACRRLPAIPDACELIAEAATFLGPTYQTPKRAGEAELRRMGFKARYIAADTGLLRPTTDVFLVRREGTKRLFIVITGTESLGDWVSNARSTPYTGKYRSGEFYAPPGHGGFRGGLMNIIGEGILRRNEFDSSPLRCNGVASAPSLLAQFICHSGGMGDEKQLELVIVGHSRGAGIGLFAATAFLGLEIKRPDPKGDASVDPQTHWPLRLHAIIGFAPPYAIARQSDRELGVDVPPGVPDHDMILNRIGIPERTILIANDRDVVPLLGFGQVLHRGHLFRVRRDRSVVYEAMLRGEPGAPEEDGLDRGLREAHSSGGYCIDVLAALRAVERCDPRTSIEPR